MTKETMIGLNPGVTCPLSGDNGQVTTNCAMEEFSIIAGLPCSNHAPSDLEAHYILKSIAHGNSHLEFLETEIRTLRETLVNLEQRQENVRNYLSSQRSLLSPIRRIPPEILGQIFLALQNVSEPICFGDDALENIEPWTLLRVCRFWRDVALSLSELWSKFTIIRQPFSRPSGREMDSMLQQTLRLTKDCLSHSHSRPLHFVFHADDEFVAAAKMIAAESSRWMSAAFNNLPVLQTLEPKLLGRLPLLHCLEIDGLGKEWDNQTQPLQAFRQAPALTRLSLYELTQPHSRFLLPWHQITHFTSFELRDFLPILHLMPSLVELKSVEDFCRPEEIQDRIILPNLERLEVTSNSPTTSQIFDALLTPKLDTLRLFSKRGFSRIYATAAVLMLRLSECHLRTLAVSDYAVDSTLRILGAVADLEDLTVTNVMYPSELFAAVTLHTLPKLRSVKLRKCAPETKLWTTLTQFLRDRAPVDRNSSNLSVEGFPLRLISIGLSASPDSRFLRNHRDAVQQTCEMAWSTLPVPNPTKSFWTDTPGANPLARLGSTGPLGFGDDIDICVIGSGITGVSIAYHLGRLLGAESEKGVQRKIVILDAREFCCNETDLYQALAQQEEMEDTLHPASSAIHPSRTELREREREENICAGKLRRRFHEEAEERSFMEDYKNAIAGGMVLEDVKFLDRDTMLQAYAGVDAPGMYTDSYNLWPLKFVSNLYELTSASANLTTKLHTLTPVISITISELPATASDETDRWVATTLRGSLSCKVVIHATNAYASYLLPQLRDQIIPTRGQMFAVRAKTSLDRLERHAWQANWDYEYWFPRPEEKSTDSGEYHPPLVILGGGRDTAGPGLEQYTMDDSVLNERVSNTLKNFLPNLYAGTGMFEEVREAEMEWTGIMGFAKDGVPVVGPLEGLPGQLIAAGFTGHGMPWCFATAEVVAGMAIARLTGVEWKAPEWLPEHYLTTWKH
ncbi:hypothetical protein NP233_g9517 [Leucocoprinus birnbaumii]|uniref:FAD dependent oxidoreductase domain-containing protein n=1 Tax=Leucocoprinus birnbaumii TaxID=56174 RepID=A0AAD5VK89_9AGAR|nr:hypothetical protein NP233_g9517 [Leucocoprinus birnbaumii]